MKRWPFENVAVAATLASVTVWAGLPVPQAATWDELARCAPTLGWWVASMAAHTGRSHAGRLREDAGKPEDWIATVSGWFVGLGVLLASTAPQRVLLAVPLVVWVLHTVGRHVYRLARPVEASRGHLHPARSGRPLV